jgi:low affinity Fe/Cu permease
LRADANVDKVMDEGIEEDFQPKKKPKDFVAIEKKLRDSLSEERFWITHMKHTS